MFTQEWSGIRCCFTSKALSKQSKHRFLLLLLPQQSCFLARARPSWREEQPSPDHIFEESGSEAQDDEEGPEITAASPEKQAVLPEFPSGVVPGATLIENANHFSCQILFS